MFQRAVDRRNIDKEAGVEVKKAYKKFKESASGVILSELDKIYNDFKKKNKVMQKKQIDDDNKEKMINIGRNSYLLKDIIEGEFRDRYNLLYSLIDMIEKKGLMTLGKTKNIKQTIKQQYDDISSIYLYNEYDAKKSNRVEDFIKKYEIDQVRFDINIGSVTIASNLFAEVRSSTMRRDTYTNPTVLAVRNIVMLLNSAIYDFMPSKSWGDRFNKEYRADGAYLGRGWSFEEIGVDLSDEKIDDDYLDQLKYKNIISDLLPFIEDAVSDNRLVETIKSKYSDDGTLNTTADLSDIESPLDAAFPNSTGYYVLKKIDDIIKLDDGSEAIFENETDVYTLRDIDTFIKNKDLKLESIPDSVKLDEYSKKLKDRIGKLSNITLKKYIDRYISEAEEYLNKGEAIKVIDLVDLGNLYIQADRADQNGIFKIPLPEEYDYGDIVYVNEITLNVLSDQGALVPTVFNNYPGKIDNIRDELYDILLDDRDDNIRAGVLNQIQVAIDGKNRILVELQKDEFKKIVDPTQIAKSVVDSPPGQPPPGGPPPPGPLGQPPPGPLGQGKP